MADRKTISFEEELQRLQEAAAAVESGHGSLADKVASYREGVEAAKSCLSLLAKAEEEVQGMSDELEAMMRGMNHD